MPKGKPVESRKCITCLVEFLPTGSTQRCCTRKCRTKYNNLKPESYEARAVASKKWEAKNKDYRRSYNLKRKYGITLEDYNRILKEQNDCCRICKKHYSESKKALAVDHDHKTGEIFGILCSYCNRHLIGRIRKPDLFIEAAKYLEKGLGIFVPKKKKRKRKKRDRNS